MKRARPRAGASKRRALSWPVPLLAASVLVAYANSVSGAFVLAAP